jgi:hypothetical protein
MEQARGYLSRHWHGDLSLPVSFWLNNVLLSVPAGMAVGALAAWITVTGDLLRSGSVAVLVSYPLLVLLSLWCTVGGWRSAQMHVASGGSAVWARLAQLILAVGALSTAWSTLFEFGPSMGSYWRMARGIDPIGNLSASLSADQQRLLLKGPIGAGDAVRVKGLLAAAPRLRVVELDSPGGRLKEAETIAAAVRERQAVTRTTGHCESACTLIHLAGTRRQVLPGAKIGFHRADTGSHNPVLDRLVNLELARTYRTAGLPEIFVQKTLATPPWDMWYPSRAELASADLLHTPERPLDVDLPAEPLAEAPAYAELMRVNDAWLAIDQHRPGALAMAAQLMATARTAGAEDAAVQVQGQRVVQALLPSLLSGAEPWLLESYLGLLIDQTSAAQGIDAGTACLAVLQGDAAARRSLPTHLLQRESSWLIDAATQPARKAASRGLTALEQEVLRRRLGDQAPALLANAWRVGRNGPEPRVPLQECKRTLELLRAVAVLPGAERRLAARVIFDRG